MRALAERAERVIATTMYHGLAVGWADLVLPGTSYLERDGSFVNLEGRVQRLRRAVVPPVPDELAWIAKLAERFGVELSPHPSAVFEELSARVFGGLPYGELGERAAAARPRAGAARRRARARAARRRARAGLRLLRYRPLFSGPAVERVPGAPVPAAAGRGRALAPRTRRASASPPATRSPSAPTAARARCAPA